jgi:RimK family alpha-L-glutamate ligase
MKKNKIVKLFEEFRKEEKKLLILNFDPIAVSKPGTEDEYSRGHERADTLLIEIAAEKGISAESYCYDSVLIGNDDIYIGEKSLKDFDYVILGMMSNKMEIVNPIIDCLNKMGIPHFDYGTPTDIGNKTQDMYNITRAGLPYVPTIITSNKKTATYFVDSNWEYPVVSKKPSSSQGDGVEKCDNVSELENTFAKATDDPSYEDFRIVQRFIPNDGDFRVLIFDGKIIAIAKRVSKDPKKEFRNNISKGGKGFSAEIPHEAVQLALDSAKAVKKQMAGVDLIQDKRDGKWYVMEINSAPQYHYFQEISGIDFPQMLIDKIYSELYGTRNSNKST